MPVQKEFSLRTILQLSIDKAASDIHIMAYRRPIIRVDGVLIESQEFDVVDPDHFEKLMLSELSQAQQEFLKNVRELGFVEHMPSGHRFRVNLFWERGHLALAARLVPVVIPTMQDVELPAPAVAFTQLDQGLVLVTGQTGNGKSTTLAAMIDHINQDRALNIITFEDPIEFLIPPKKSIVRQRELGSDINSVKESLKYVVRHDPDVIVVGEMRDSETISMTITLAETGHLVFSTLHTFDASQTIHRIIDSFPPEQQTQIRLQLAMTLRGIISQRLIPRAAGKGRVAAREILINNAAVANLIRENKVEQIPTILQTGNSTGMMTMDQHLISLYKNKTITKETACAHMLHPEFLEKMV
ncbi:PilT/PilU family type 4a pilus ATPase [Candidatus Uhrbacteria bacterium]|nr:PilT/PilU family type 4a pilus ATPase [Candidatus Uhrbacteria bacterium]